MVDHLPHILLTKILRQQPFKARCRFRAICKDWQAIIDELSTDTLILRNPTGSGIFTISLDSSFDRSEGCQVMDLLPRPRSSSHDPEGSVIFRYHILPSHPIASCNGLILLSRSSSNLNWAILNPMTREFHHLPKLPYPDVSVVACGFGHDHATGDYKVVGIMKASVNGQEFVYKTYVYSLRCCSWRAIQDCPYEIPCWSKNGVFLNGAVHWNSWEGIIALDLADEEYRELPFPTVFPPGLRREVNLQVLGGYFGLSYYCDVRKTLIGWVMKEYGVERSWTKLFSLEELDVNGVFRYLRPVVYSESKRKLLLQDMMYGFVLWDLDYAFGKEIMFEHIPTLSYQVFHESPIKLSKIVGGVVEKLIAFKSGMTIHINIRKISSSCPKSSIKMRS